MSERIQERFIPGTTPRPIGDGVFFRPIRSWHSATYAGERLTKVRGDGSGCMWPEKFHGLEVCSVPYTVTHRLYWHENAPDETLSAFLSYPDAMGCSGGEYFWEAFGVNDDGVSRYFGENAEAEMESAIKARLLSNLSKPELLNDKG